MTRYNIFVLNENRKKASSLHEINSELMKDGGLLLHLRLLHLVNMC